MGQKLVNGIVTGTLFQREPVTDEEKKQRAKLMYERYQAKFFPSVQTVTPETLQGWLKEEGGNSDTPRTVLVDCRSKEEREVSTIQGSITQEEFESKEDDLASSPHVVFFCTIGLRSGRAAKSAVKRGKIEGGRIFNLEGSLLLWLHAGGQVYDMHADQVVNRVHVYGKTWDLAPDGMVTETF